MYHMFSGLDLPYKADPAQQPLTTAGDKLLDDLSVDDDLDHDLCLSKV